MSNAYRLAEAANSISKPVLSEDDEREEMEMAMTQLKSLVEKATEAMSLIKTGKPLEPWVQSKITMADDYITTIRDYMKHSTEQ